VLPTFDEQINEYLIQAKHLPFVIFYYKRLIKSIILENFIKTLIGQRKSENSRFSLFKGLLLCHTVQKNVIHNAVPNKASVNSILAVHCKEILGGLVILGCDVLKIYVVIVFGKLI